MAVDTTKITSFRDRSGVVRYPKTCSDAVIVDEGVSLTEELSYIKEELAQKVDYKDSNLKDVVTFNDLEVVTNIKSLAYNREEVDNTNNEYAGIVEDDVIIEDDAENGLEQTPDNQPL